MAMSMKAARVNAGYTQEEACKLLGITKSTLCSYENYKTVPSILMAQKMAEAYKLTINDIEFRVH